MRVFDVFWAIVSTISLIPSFSVCRAWQTRCNPRVRVFPSVSQVPARSCIPVSSESRDSSSLYANTRHSSLHTLAIPTEIALTRSRLALFFSFRVLVPPSRARLRLRTRRAASFLPFTSFLRGFPPFICVQFPACFVRAVAPSCARVPGINIPCSRVCAAFGVTCTRCESASLHVENAGAKSHLRDP